MSAPRRLTLRATVQTQFPQGVRGLNINRFVDGYRHTMLVGGEIVCGIQITKKPGRGYFRKLGARNSLVISIAMVAGVFHRDDRGNLTTARVALGSCSPVPMRLTELERTMLGKPLDPALVQPEHLAMLSPIDDIRASAKYRRAAALQLVKDVIAEAAEDQGGGSG
jgi:xanthine dehydrogenase small subunit